MNYRSSYSQKLRDPRWQKKRLEVMQYRDFCCEICGDSESTLNVHHKQYLKGYEPWDYHAEQLACICETCHKEYHDLPDILSLICSYLPIDGKNNRVEIAILIAGILGKGIAQDASDYEKLIYKLGELFDNVDKNAVISLFKGNK